MMLKVTLFKTVYKVKYKMVMETSINTLVEFLETVIQKHQM